MYLWVPVAGGRVYPTIVVLFKQPLLLLDQGSTPGNMHIGTRTLPPLCEHPSGVMNVVLEGPLWLVPSQCCYYKG